MPLSSFESRPFGFSHRYARVAGSLLGPATLAGNSVCALLIGGTLSQTRDGDRLRPRGPCRTALRTLAEALAELGIPSLRYDRVGYGDSEALPGWEGSYAQEAEVAAAALGAIRSGFPGVRVVAIAESAGAYLACLASREGAEADAYVFLGALCGSAEDLYEYTFGGLVAYAESSPERLARAQREYAFDLALGRHYREMLRAAVTGAASWELRDGDFRCTLPLARRREELLDPCDRLFRHIRVPALALAGACDLNVPPDHARRAAEVMWNAGNPRASWDLIPGVDHSFQESAADWDQRIHDRYSYASFGRAYAPGLYTRIGAWIRGLERLDLLGARGTTTVAESRAHAAVPAPELAAEQILLGEGLHCIDQVRAVVEAPGVPTPEGRIGPLLLGAACQAHFIEMPAWLFVAEHPHASESLIYTISGNWVLCSHGRRRLMRPGSLFWFDTNVPTGYEVPFNQAAVLLILKGQRLSDTTDQFVRYLRGMAASLHGREQNGCAFTFAPLAHEHPACRFGRSVNPSFDAGRVLAIR